MSYALWPRNATQSLPPQSGQETVREVSSSRAEIPIRWLDVRLESLKGEVA